MGQLNKFINITGQALKYTVSSKWLLKMLGQMVLDFPPSLITCTQSLRNQQVWSVGYLADVHGELVLGLKALITQWTADTPAVIFGFLKQI